MQNKNTTAMKMGEVNKRLINGVFSKVKCIKNNYFLYVSLLKKRHKSTFYLRINFDKKSFHNFQCETYFFLHKCTEN